MGYGEDANNDPRIGRPLVVFLGRPEKEVKVLLAELIQVLLVHLGQGKALQALGLFEAVPVELAGFPVEHLQLAFPPICIEEPVREFPREFADDMEALTPVLRGKQVTLVIAIPHLLQFLLVPIPLIRFPSEIKYLGGPEDAQGDLVGVGRFDKGPQSITNCALAED
jgi:hypothetical protein